MHLYSFCFSFRDGGVAVMWDSDALTEHLHKPAPQKSKANRVHIQKHALPHNMKMWWKNVIQCLQLQKPQLSAA